MKRYVIRNRIRFLLSVSMIMITVVSAVFTLAVSAKGSSEGTMKAEYVEEGDTLWSLSMNYAGDMDLREYISKVMDINNLQSANIRPGDLLYFPEYN